VTRDELAELLLTYLHDKAEAEPHSFFFFPLEEFAVSAGLTDPAELLAMARDLEEIGFVMLSQDLLGQISALINLDGSSWVEKGGKTGIIAKYRENPEAFLKPQDTLPPWLSQPDAEFAQFAPEMPEGRIDSHGLGATERESQGSGIKERIIQIINAILDDASLDDVMRADLLRDAETLNIQLAKTVRNQAVIDLLMQELSSIPSLAVLVAELSSYR
jgi:hypothetical protein